MPTIVDPDNLLDSLTDSAQNIFINTGTRNIIVRNNSAAPSGPTLDETGVTGQALYSFLKEQWKDDPKGKNLISYPFPMIAITPEQFEFRYGWKPDSDVSRSLIRTAGWREYLADNTTLEKQFMGVITLGNIDGEQTGTIGAADQDQVYYAFYDATNRTPVAPTTTAPIVFDYPGQVNQAVKTFDNGTLTDGSAQNNLTDILTVFIRTQGKTYDQTRTVDIGISAGTTLPYNVQRFPLAEGQDLNVTVSDAGITDPANNDTTVDGGGNVTTAIATKYDSAAVNYLAASVLSSTLGYTQDLTGGPYPFGITIDASSPDVNGSLRKQELYSWVQYYLRQDSDIPGTFSTAYGRLQDELLEFVGPTLKTKTATNPGGAGNANTDKASGTAIIDFYSPDINDLAFRSDSAVTTTGLADRVFPFTANFTLSFSDTISQDGANAAFSVFFERTRRTSVSDFAITNAGTAATAPAGFEEIDSATFTSSGGNFSVVYNAGAPATVNSGDYIKIGGASNSNNNQVYKVTNVITPSANAFSVISYDNLPIVDSAFSATIDEHPINSPDALLVDSAGTTTPNTGGISGDLTGNLSTVTFSYDFEGNTQGDKPAGDTQGNNPANIIIRAIGLTNGSYVEVSATIERLASQTFSVVSALERNYSNP